MSSSLPASERAFIEAMALAALKAPTQELAHQALDALTAMGFDPDRDPVSRDAAGEPSTSYMERASREGIGPMALALIAKGFSPHPLLAGPSPLASRIAVGDLEGVEFFSKAGADWLASAPKTICGGDQTLAEFFLFDRVGPSWMDPDLPDPWEQTARAALAALAQSPGHWTRALQAAIEAPLPFSRANRAMLALSQAGASMAQVSLEPSLVALEGHSLFDIAAWASGARATPLLLAAREIFPSSWSETDRSKGLGAFCSGAWQRMARVAEDKRGRFCLEEGSSAPELHWACVFACSSPTELFDLPMAMEQASLGWLMGAACHYQRAHPATWLGMVQWCQTWAGEARRLGNAWDPELFLAEFARGAGDPPPRALPLGWKDEARRNGSQVPESPRRAQVERAAVDFCASIPELAPLAKSAPGELRDAWTERACRDLLDELKGEPFQGTRPFPVGFVSQLAEDAREATARGWWDQALGARRLSLLASVAQQAAALPGLGSQAVAALEKVVLSAQQTDASPSPRPRL